MKKADLLDKLVLKFHKVLTPKERRDDDGIKEYAVEVFDKTEEDVLSRHLLTFYVENEGKSDEAAYWDTTEPNSVWKIRDV